MNKILSILFIILLSSFVPADSSPDCVALLKGYAKKMSMLSAPSTGKTYHIHYVLSNEMRDYEQSTVEVDARMGSNGRVAYRSNVMDFYQDTANAFAIIHAQRVIIKSKPDKQSMAMRKQSMQLLQDSLFKYCEVKSCATGKYQNTDVRIIEMRPKKPGRLEEKLLKVVYYFNEKEDRLEAQEIFFPASSPVYKQTIRYRKLDFSGAGKMKARAADYIFESGKLRQEYKGYSIEDNRK